jgi:hypothetical protein
VNGCWLTAGGPGGIVGRGIVGGGIGGGIGVGIGGRRRPLHQGMWIKPRIPG